MMLKYKTATATLIQFICLSFLNIATALDSVITNCHERGSDCLTNAFASLVFYIFIVTIFASVWVLGYSAQHRRSRRLAQVLILVEIVIALFALVNIKLRGNLIGLFTSLVDLILAVWIITLAYRLMRSSGGRIVSKQRARKRRSHVTRP